ncbi:hypothetical protein BJX63DRAFT_53256 [Aspergillus granulosus]|uniref:Uncharacterized protein n=1 Tax=Aspergillus granulosus TaxID=176169 RepID=A0ABR4GXX1_9EURO
MAPTRPYLPPLSTPKSMTFPSELRERTYTCLDSAKPVEHCDTQKTSTTSEEAEMPITPPSAYTEFLNTFSPIFASPNSSRANFSKFMLDQPPRPSPTSAPPSATGFPSPRGSYKLASSTLAPSSVKCLKSPAQSPDRVRRLRLPPPPVQSQHQHQYHLYTPLTASPLSAHAPQYHQRPSSRYSPMEWRFHQLESPASDAAAFNLRQVVTTTITFQVAPRLAAPPAGKRKKAGATRRNP